jgi:hypothetical protein
VSWPAPTRKDHEAFCAVEGWQRVRDARGRTGTHHVTYELALPDGRILRTRISHPVDRSGYGASLWGHILRDQLQVTEAEFWAAVREHKKPNRGAPEPPPQALPADVVHLLISRVGLPEAEVAAMTKDQAIDRLQRYWAEGS